MQPPIGIHRLPRTSLTWSQALKAPPSPSASDLLLPPSGEPPQLTPDDPRAFRKVNELLDQRNDVDKRDQVNRGERLLSHWRLKKVAVATNSGTLLATTRGPNPVLALEAKPLYVRLGMMVLYKGPASQVFLNTHEAAVLGEKETQRQGARFDSPRHALKEIRRFVKAYHIDTTELLLPNLTDYKTFNEFFYRRLKPTARPIADPTNTNIISSMADCRLTVFSSVDNAQKFWIKGRDFTLRELLGDDALAETLQGGEVAIFRLAPADYHRYHVPVDGKVGRSWTIPGAYLTVDPMVVKDPNLDVFGTNRRDITLLNCASPSLPRATSPVALVQVGALLVGSVNRVVTRGEGVKRGEEFGYFAYGGSTVVAVFPAESVLWDTDLYTNSRAALETVVKVGDRIGRWRT